jgi:ABC-2 type transport system ATP-binding protein
MISVYDLSRKFGPVRAVDDLSFEVRNNEIFALLGPNGAGKTTTIKMILGMLKPNKGTVHFNGKEIMPGDNSFKSRIGYVPENCVLYENLKGREYLEFVGNLHHLDPGMMHEKIERLLDLLELKNSAEKLIREYSKGMKQKILIISSLLHDPDLVILDEPFSGLDANAVSIFKELFRQESRQGKSIIFCSHVLEVVERLVDRILIINKGRKLAEGTPQEIVMKTKFDTLDRAFNALTGAGDIDVRAREIIQTIKTGREENNSE